MKYDYCDASDSPPVKKTPPKKATSKKDAVNAAVSEDAALGKAIRYCEVRSRMSTLDAEKKKLSSDIKELAIKMGVKDPSGSSVLELPQGYMIANRAKRSQSVDHVAACKLLQEKGLLERCTKRVVDEGSLEIAFQEGLLTLDEIDKFTTENVSFSVEVKAPKA